jgi:tetratricopeptide (TPR) repeat protein
MVERLDEIRLRHGDSLHVPQMAADCLAAFRDYGVDLEAGDEESNAALIRGSAIAGDLRAALDSWAVLLSRDTPDAASEAGRLFRVAALSDDDEWRNRLRRAFAEEDYAALRALASAAETEGLTAASVWLLAQALVSAESPEAAIAFLKQAHLQHAEDFWVNFLLGTFPMLTEPPRPEEGVGYLLAARAIRPRGREVLHQLGIALSMTGDWSAAASVWRRMLEIDPEYVHAWSHLYEAARETGTLDAEIESLRGGIERGSDTAEDWFRLAVAHRVRVEPAKAMQAFRRAVEIDPEMDDAQYGLSYVLLALGRWREAERSLLRCAELRPDDANTWFQLAWVRRRLRDFPGAVEAHEQARRICPSYPTYHTAVAGAQAEGGDLEAALESYEELRARFPDRLATADLEYALAVRLWNELRTREALEIGRRARDYFERKLAETPDDTYMMGRLGGLLNDVFQEHDAAIELFERIRDQVPDDLSILLNLGIAYESKNDVAGAIEFYTEVEEKFPKSLDGPRWLGRTYRMLGRLEESCEAFLRMERLAPRLPAAVYQVAWSLLILGRREEAVERFRRVIEIDPDGTRNAFSFSWASYFLGFADLADGRTEEGLAHLDRWRAAAARKDSWWYPEETWERDRVRIVRLAARLGEFERGGELPPDPRDRLLLGLVAMGTGRYALAAPAFEAAFGADPDVGREFCPFEKPRLFFEFAAMMAAAQGGACEWSCAGLAEKERARWRALAVEWLHATIAGWRRLLAERGDLGPKDAAGALEALGLVPHLAVIREEEHLRRLPEEERRACRELWRAVDEFEAELRNLR